MTYSRGKRAFFCHLTSDSVWENSDALVGYLCASALSSTVCTCGAATPTCAARLGPVAIGAGLFFIQAEKTPGGGSPSGGLEVNAQFPIYCLSNDTPSLIGLQGPTS